MPAGKLNLPLRNQRLTACLDLSGEGIEYGPLHRPILSRDTAPGIRYVDYETRDFLVGKYANDPGVVTENIPEVDIVTAGKKIDQFLPPNSIDFVLASHVAEHVPDLIGWLKSNATVLRPGGHIACAFPDRRYTFDLTRTPTRTADLVAAYLENRQKPNLQQIASHLIEAREARAPEIWSGEITAQTAAPKRTLDQAIAQLERISGSDGYHDVHCWVFSDSDFYALIPAVCKKFLPNLDLVSFLPTEPGTNEFMFTLRKTA